MSWCGGGLVVEPSEVERMKKMEDRIEEVQPDNSVLDDVPCALCLVQGLHKLSGRLPYFNVNRWPCYVCNFKATSLSLRERWKL